MPSRELKDRINRVAEYLELLVFDAGVPIRQLETRLNVSHGSVNRILSSKVELKFRHVFEILDIIGMPDEVFFKGLAAALQGERPRATEMRRRVQKTPLPASTHDASGVTREEVLELIQSYFEGSLDNDEEQVPAPERRRRRIPRRGKKPS
jgi:transcriptional regulator with XRE-family HTH domain